MSDESQNLLRHKICNQLRSKEMFYDIDCDVDDDDYSSGIFWCSNTESCLGPDGKSADDESCGADRACHER